MKILYSILIMPPGKYYGGEKHHIILAKRLKEIKNTKVRIITYNLYNYSDIWEKMLKLSSKIENIEGIETVRLPVINLLPKIVNAPSYISQKILWYLATNYRKLQKKIKDKSLLYRALLILSEYYMRRIGYIPFSKIEREVEEFRPDIIHVYGVHWTNLAYRLARIALKKNIKLSIWSIYHHILFRERLFMMRPVIIDILGKSDVIISSTNVEREVIYNMLKGRFPSKIEQMVVVPVPIEVESFIDPPKEDVERLYDFLGNPDKVILTMTLNKEKGAIDVLKSLSKIDIKERIALVSFGRARREEIELFKKISEKLPKNVEPFYLGYVDEKTKAALFCFADIFAMPSISDSFGIAYAEAWYYGKPVIAAENPVMEEVIGNMKRGILVPYGDLEQIGKAIRILLEDQDLAQRLARNGKDYLYSELESSKVAKRVYDIYKRVLGN